MYIYSATGEYKIIKPKIIHYHKKNKRKQIIEHMENSDQHAIFDNLKITVINYSGTDPSSMKF